MPESNTPIQPPDSERAADRTAEEASLARVAAASAALANAIGETALEETPPRDPEQLVIWANTAAGRAYFAKLNQKLMEARVNGEGGDFVRVASSEPAATALSN